MIEISGETIIRGFLVAILSGAMAYVVYTVEANGAYPEENKQRYRPLIVGYVLPLYLVSLGGLSAAFGSEEMLQNILSICFCIFLQICLYYAVLLSVLPLLRRRISAVACAMLWLVPNYLYIAFNGLMELVRPRLVLHASAGLLRTLSLIWLAGAIVVMGWKILSHLIFRRRLLREAPGTRGGAFGPMERGIGTGQREKAQVEAGDLSPGHHAAFHRSVAPYHPGGAAGADLLPGGAGADLPP